MHSRSLQKFAPFLPKMVEHDVLKHHFLKEFSTDFSEILVEDVKLMPEQVLIVSRRYLPPFLSYRENPAGGGGRICPPSGVRFKMHPVWKKKEDNASYSPSTTILLLLVVYGYLTSSLAMKTAPAGQGYLHSSPYV